MEELVYLNGLYDYYGELLTDKQREFFEAYYFDNLTLQEIAEQHGISRNAVHKALTTISEKLKYYEQKLGFYVKTQKIQECIKDEDLLQQILEIL